jgi:hypothetical protein
MRTPNDYCCPYAYQSFRVYDRLYHNRRLCARTFKDVFGTRYAIHLTAYRGGILLAQIVKKGAQRSASTGIDDMFGYGAEEIGRYKWWLEWPELYKNQT